MDEDDLPDPPAATVALAMGVAHRLTLQAMFRLLTVEQRQELGIHLRAIARSDLQPLIGDTGDIEGAADSVKSELEYLAFALRRDDLSALLHGKPQEK